MKKHDLQKAFAFDHHFEVLGFVRLSPSRPGSVGTGKDLPMDAPDKIIEQHRLIDRWEVYSRDTAPEIERRRLAAARNTPPWRKLQMAAEMSQTARALTLAGLRHRYPEADEQEIRFRFATLLFGPEIARRICPPLDKGESNAPR